jgi:hypothetical protein
MTHLFVRRPAAGIDAPPTPARPENQEQLIHLNDDNRDLADRGNENLLLPEFRSSYEFNYTGNHHLKKKGFPPCSRGTPGKQPGVPVDKKYQVPAPWSCIQVIAWEVMA